MNSENPPSHPTADPLDFLSIRLREILRRLAKADRRDEISELVYLIEARARGQLRDVGDEAVSPRVQISDLAPDLPLIQDVRVRRVPGSTADMPFSRPTREVDV